METKQGSGISNHPTALPDSSPGNSDSPLEGIVSVASSSSSSSSSSSQSSSSGGSCNLLLELNNAKDEDHEDPLPKSEQESPSSPKPVTVTELPNQSLDWGSTNASPRAGPGPSSSLDNNWNPFGPSEKQSPPVQTMGRSNIPGYDPNRLPPSIFASKPATPMEWSVASNESLFSIHMGNNSFSRDHAILLGKSGELYKFDDLIASAPSQQTGNGPRPNEANIPPYNLPTVIETTSDIDNHRERNVSIGEDLNMRRETDITPKATEKETHFLMNTSNVSDGRETPTHDGTRTSASTHQLSDESGTNSSSSFAFPVLLGEGGTCAPLKMVPHENKQVKPIEKAEMELQLQKPTPKASHSKWFSWFPTFSFPRCRFCC